MHWDAPPKPADLTEQRLITAILDGTFPPDSHLPAERDLAQQLGVTRPTLREALQRIARDGWIDIQHGKPTRIRHVWTEGSLGVLSGIARYPDHQPPEFVPHLLQIRLLLAPEYAAMAVRNNPDQVLAALEPCLTLAEDPQAFTTADWNVHLTLTIASTNPIFTLILNGFRDLYLVMGARYFQSEQARGFSRGFYTDLHACTLTGNCSQAEEITRTVMARSINIWDQIPGGEG